MNLKKCKYCGTTTNLRTDSKDRVYNECYSCIKLNEQNERNNFIIYLKELNYSISSKEELVFFFIKNGNKFSEFKGRILKSLFVLIQEYNNNNDFNTIKNIEEMLKGSHLNKRSSTLEIV